MSNDFEQSRQDHLILERVIPPGHGMLDQKYGKGMRSPMLGQLPQDAGLETPSMPLTGDPSQNG